MASTWHEVGQVTLESDIAIGAVLAALYLRGMAGSTAISLPQWPAVLHRLRQSPQTALPNVSSLLAKHGFTDAAAVLSDATLLTKCLTLCHKGLVLAVSDARYPRRWLDVLGSSAPAALWVSALPAASPRVAVVGSRDPCSVICGAVCSSVQAVSSLGYGILSGGAPGVDNIAAAQATTCISLLAHGLLPRRVPMVCPQWAIASPATPFSAGLAMERNALIFAGSEVALVFGPRFRQGGTWAAAIQALRRKLTRVCVFSGQTSPAVDSLIALGASPFSCAADLISMLTRHSSEYAGMFGLQVHSTT